MRVDSNHDSPAGAQQKQRSAHLVGIGGSGMRALATVLAERGWKISGSDLQPDAAAGLMERGVRVLVGHASSNVPADAELLIYSDAVPADNPERLLARQRDIPERSYAQMLGTVAAEFQLGGGQVMAVAGTHGKSTVTAMTAEILIRAGLDPTVVCGAAALNGGVQEEASPSIGRSNSLPGINVTHPGASGIHSGGNCNAAQNIGETGGRHGDGKLMLVEACEYRENFLHLRPNVAALLNVEPDHFDYYRTPAQLHEAILQFVRQIVDDGWIMASHECGVAQKIAAAAGRRAATFGFSRAADWRATNLEHRLGRYRFDLVRHDKKLAHVTLGVTGRHHVLNAVAAAGMARHCGVSAQQIAQGLAAFRGLKRRLEVRGRWGGVPWVDDYAHHPTEVKAALATVRQMFPRRRVWCVFQPHQASRLAALLDETAASLHNADRIAVADVYRARESAGGEGEATAADVADLLTAGGNEVLDEHHPVAIAERLSNELQPGDVLLTMGAGDLGKIFDEFQKRVRRNCAVA
ncbi:MAG TPA: Mur ligase family protein [Pirellulales bacterium]|nr:Mur ligase family protein [Pirellulales bacterium]